jgi:hypothetical protein
MHLILKFQHEKFLKIGYEELTLKNQEGHHCGFVTQLLRCKKIQQSVDLKLRSDSTQQEMVGNEINFHL